MKGRKGINQENVLPQKKGKLENVDLRKRKGKSRTSGE